ncbi:MAG: Hsp20/alpha crystallin family protein [Patescibacteria group bacterium]|nr:Hsp20/alpha crystallin family protein [Patescibacteria group bacterium]
MKKRSFFERLTGSVALDGDELELDISSEETTDQPTWKDEAEEEGELAVDVYQTPSEIIIRAMVAGVKPEDLDVNITREMVTIRGRREVTREVNTEDYFQRELYWGSFTRAISLPTEIEVEEAEAIEKHGLLTLRLPKIDKQKNQSLKVKSL